MIFPNKASPKITDLKNESPPILMGQHFCIQHSSDIAGYCHIF